MQIQGHPNPSPGIQDWLQRLGPAFDAAVLAQWLGPDPRTRETSLARLLQAFGEALRQRLLEMEQAIGAADFQSIRRVAHTLASSSAALGAAGFAGRCLELERCALGAGQECDTARNASALEMARLWLPEARALRDRVCAAAGGWGRVS